MLNNVNANTIVVPITVLGSVAFATWVLSSNLNTKFTDVKDSISIQSTQFKDAQKELGFKVEKLETRLTTIESIKVTDRWTTVDMFKWAVHLQKSNPTMKVPEPDGRTNGE